MFRKLGLSLALIAAFMVTACSDSDKDKNKVVFAQATDGFLYVPLYVARAKGYFKDEGLNVDAIVFKGGAPAMTAVIKNEAQVLISSPPVIVNARKQGLDMIAFSAVMDQF